METTNPIDERQQYDELIQAIIDKMAVVLGKKLAAEKARHIAGVFIDNQSVLSATTGNPQEIIKGLVQEYEKLSGDIARRFARQAAEDVTTRYPHLIIPDILKPNPQDELDSFLEKI